MAENSPQEYRPLTREELSELAGEELPERAAMSLINANVAAPVNAAVAANVLSDNSVALPTSSRPRTSRRPTRRTAPVDRLLARAGSSRTGALSRRTRALHGHRDAVRRRAGRPALGRAAAPARRRHRARRRVSGLR